MPEARENEDDLERLRAVVRANPRSTTFVALAHALCDAGKDQEAEEVCRQGLAQHPSLTTGQVALGRVLLARGRLREAQEALIEAAKSSPEHGDAFRWLGEVVLTRGDRERARTILEYAEELAPSDAAVGDLLAKAGGKPLPRHVRPKTDFEHTRVGDARALAQRMHEDPPVLAPSGEEPSTPVVELGNGKAQGKTTKTSKASKRPDKKTEKKSDRRLPSLETIAAGLRSAGRGRGRGTEPAADDIDEETEPETNPFPGAEPGRRDSEGGITAAPGPGASGPIGLTPAARRSMALADRWPQVPRALLYGGPLALLGGVLVLVFALRGDRPRTAPPTRAPATRAEAPAARLDFFAAISDGGLERLQAARAQSKPLVQSPGKDLDGLAQLAMVNALLASEHGQSTAADAEEAAAAVEKAGKPSAAQRALLEGARALAALAAGRLPEATAAAERATAIEVEGAPAAARLARFASGRVRLMTGDLDAAAKDLSAAAGQPGPGRLALAALAGAALALDTGRVDAATLALDELTAARKDLLPARLLLAEARRAAGVPAAAEELQKDCKEQGRDGPFLRTQCAVEAATASRLAGDRGAALKAARAAVAGARRQVNARGVAQGALMLANLGDIDGAADALRRIREEAAPGFPPRALAELAVTTGRGESVTAGPLLAGAVSPDGRLLAARLALAAGGPKQLGSYLAELDRKLLEQDPDLRLLATLADEGKLEGEPRQEATRRSDGGSSLAAYVLGRHELAAGNKKSAGQWLALALKGHGDSCEAGRLLLSIDAKDRPAAYRQAARVVRAVRGRNGGCLHLRER